MSLDLTDKDITWDALLTQRSIAQYVRSKLAHYHAPVKANQSTLLKDLEDQFKSRSPVPGYKQTSKGHGRLEVRSIWCTEKLNDYVNFPDVAQAYVIERKVTNNLKTQVTTCELAYGVTSRPAADASPKDLLKINRGHWAIENSCHYVLDVTFEEDRSRIRKGYRSAEFHRAAALRHRLDPVRGQGGRRDHPAAQPQGSQWSWTTC